ncbi:hypothetical protein GTCCBUS3UF5_2250 [Geobacillus thermoleovorans CCB_US3_UF5]|uniref:Uncharacterized protein n=1 Tax=Geobacillus thermoleovorans CCB_US3_UF5 TaxID=1111068 RepID=A0ABM5MDB6_GEOTH|nr:hypothetical protein GTCCBUS3UF5_2250 [Geobacillus thermoleovorans CCB_US3_UF5]
MVPVGLPFAIHIDERRRKRFQCIHILEVGGHALYPFYYAERML